MQYVKEIVTGVGTLAIAVGIGFVMQNSESAKSRYGDQAQPVPIDAQDASQEISGVSASADIMLQVQEIELTSASDITSVPMPKTDTDIQRVAAPTADLAPEADSLPVVDECEMVATATPVAGAMVTLTLDAACVPNERLTVHHNGMMFTETTDATGSLSMTVPALTDQAVFIMAFSNGDGAVAQATVTDIAQYDRVALQWRGRAGFELHAREFGADYGQSGHLWSGSAQNIDGLTSGDNGLLTRLGDTQSTEPLMVEIYTFPSHMSARPGVIDMTVEAEVTASNCGLEIEAQSLEVSAGGQLKTQNLTLSVPDCDAVGSFLVLNNLVGDLKVAGN
jgi:hypothetical protein